MAKRIKVKDVKHIDFDFNEYVTEFADHPDWSTQDFGALFRIDLQLYREGGKIKDDPARLARLCRLSDKKFAKTWRRIKSKYHKSGGFLFRKRIRLELQKARRRMQLAHNKGVMGAEARYSKHSTGIANENETKPNTNKNLISSSNSKKPARSPSISLRFYEALSVIIKPRNQSDRTAFRNLGNWIEQNILTNQFTEEIYKVILDFAIESKKGRKPAAMFFATLQREIGYRKKE